MRGRPIRGWSRVIYHNVNTWELLWHAMGHQDQMKAHTKGCCKQTILKSSSAVKRPGKARCTQSTS